MHGLKLLVSYNRSSLAKKLSIWLNSIWKNKKNKRIEIMTQSCVNVIKQNKCYYKTQLISKRHRTVPRASPTMTLKILNIAKFLSFDTQIDELPRIKKRSHLRADFFSFYR